MCCNKILYLKDKLTKNERFILELSKIGNAAQIGDKYSDILTRLSEIKSRETLLEKLQKEKISYEQKPNGNFINYDYKIKINSMNKDSIKDLEELAKKSGYKIEKS